ncbi:Soluble liver antigen/liver pancreas antigen (SHypothetical protein/LP autoantigen) [Nesidiocoris tenuis]|uniref:O-phosphoseryl-tRNA(Sec) selenium transferase n=1 Tax=Nesidiocoris tenuis TaxID=355587 RepID=A0ABN7ACQ1_9HEMI|nr:Soluble liver antigen/liver pancreas antigen (SHypothetical protein/LP autoantigen) [Nesidiocoris tenuis]
MNSQSFTLAERLIPSTYLQQAASSKRARENLIRALIEQRKWPEEGWDESTIELFMADLAQMDSNNFPGNSGVGEREARFASSLVARRHYRLGHGIGRSGDIGEVQPKAAGSSLLTKLANALLLDTIRFMGVNNSAGCFLVPMATGMSLVLCMLTLKQDRPAAKFVLWSRIDQKSCFKCILTAGLQPIIIEPVMSGDELRTDVNAFETQMSTLGSNNIVCVLSTTSCFAPRASDSLEQIAALCSRYNIPHLVNNAYGLQSSRLMHLIQEAAKKGRVDAFVQSTDKNLLVPVGGAIISGFDKGLLERISRNYPGRASASPVIDVFMTLLSLGSNGYKNLICERKEMFKYLKEELGKIAAKHGERILDTRNNPISMAMTLSTLNAGGDNKRVPLLGSMLFLRYVSGTRCITGTEHKDVATYHFEGWGAHHSSATCPYITAAAGIGMKKSDVDLFVHRLDKALAKVKGRSAPPTPTSVEELGSSGRRSGNRVVNGESGEQGSSAGTSLASSKDSLRK